MSEALRLQISKVVRATRGRAFDAWTKPELLLKWFGPGNMLPTEVEVDLRPEGRFRFVISGCSPRTGLEMTITFVGPFRAIVPNERISFDWEVAGDPGEPTLVTVDFREVDAGTEVILTHERIPNAELLNRNQFGWTAMLEKLAGVAELPEFVEAR